jgi:hypothetical protein
MYVEIEFFISCCIYKHFTSSHYLLSRRFVPCVIIFLGGKVSRHPLPISAAYGTKWLLCFPASLLRLIQHDLIFVIQIIYAKVLILFEPLSKLILSDAKMYRSSFGRDFKNKIFFFSCGHKADQGFSLVLRISVNLSKIEHYCILKFNNILYSILPHHILQGRWT